MACTLTSGLLPVTRLRAYRSVKLRVFVTNLENAMARATVEVLKLASGKKLPLIHRELEIPGDDRRAVELPNDAVAGQVVEVTVTLLDSDLQRGSGLRPSVAVVGFCPDDGSTSLLQWVSASEFVPANPDFSA